MSDLRAPKNTLLTAAGGAFDFDSLSSSAVLLPVNQESKLDSSADLTQAEAANFVGQTESAEPKPFTFFSQFGGTPDPFTKLTSDSSPSSKIEQKTTPRAPTSHEHAQSSGISSFFTPHPVMSPGQPPSTEEKPPSLSTPISAMKHVKSFSDTTMLKFPSDSPVPPNPLPGATMVSPYPPPTCTFASPMAASMVAATVTPLNQPQSVNVAPPSVMPPVATVAPFGTQQTSPSIYQSPLMVPVNDPPVVSPLPPHTTPAYVPSTTTPAYQPQTQFNISPGSYDIPTIQQTSWSLTSNYTPISHHWFYCVLVDKKPVWKPYSYKDSMALEQAYIEGSNTLTPTEGGRFDVDVVERLSHSVYWKENPKPVRRCSWFYKTPLEKKAVPYEEHFASKLEEEYHEGLISGTWNRKLQLPGGEMVLMHNSTAMFHLPSFSEVDDYENLPESHGQGPARVVKRGIEGFEIEDGELDMVDNLVFVVHGIGPVCDLKFRTIVEVVDCFRSLSSQMLSSHFSSAKSGGRAGRTEFLPLSWHHNLHGDATGIDKRLKSITLRSVPFMRNFINETLMDILFYTSPTYCQTIMDTVGNELNRMFATFQERQPDFSGNVFLCGHSLGSIILFDLLAHQSAACTESEPETDTAATAAETTETIDGETTLDSLFSKLNISEWLESCKNQHLDLETLHLCNEEDLKELGLPTGPRKKLLMTLQSHKNALRVNSGAHLNHSDSNTSTVNYTLGEQGTGQPYVEFPQLSFHPAAFFALGSPIVCDSAWDWRAREGLPSANLPFDVPHLPPV